MVTACAIHLSDLHRGARPAPELDEALVALAEELRPEFVVASGDLANRGRARELAEAHALLERLPAPVLAVPGNHDIPYTLPARVTRPWARFEAELGTTEPVLRTEHAVVCGLNSAWPWRHQGGRLTRRSLAHAAGALGEARPGALRVVVLHHHMTGAPWRVSRKRPLKQRDAALRSLADAGADLVLGGHIHQSTVVTRRAFEALAPGDAGRSIVLSTAPGFGRPRPHRLGEANGLHVVRWGDDHLEIEMHVWERGAFVPASATSAPRCGLVMTGASDYTP